MTQQEILNSTRTKTWKIQQLLGLGLTRTQVANLIGCGYGFVQNVYARMHRTINQELPTNYNLENFVFNHTFGVEIEATGIAMDELRNELWAVGVSIQTESYNHSTRDYWKIVSDASIRGTNCFELVSPKLEGMAGLRELKTVLLIVRGLGAQVNKSCGVHIHFDAGNFTLKTWKNLLWNYSILEKEIDSVMPISRRENNNSYCKSLRTENYERFFTSFSETENLTNGMEKLIRFYRNDRYYKVNLMSFIRQRSIEFRQHSGTVNHDKIINWITFLARLIEFSKSQAITETANFETFKYFLDEETFQFFRTRQQELRRA